MNLADCLKRDWAANRQNAKGRLVTVMFRFGAWFRQGSRFMNVIGWPYLVTYRICVEWILGVELPALTKVGPGLKLHHGQGLVVNNRAVIGANCVLRHGVTLGNKGIVGMSFDCPVLEDGVVVGANAVILGPVRIGQGAVVGAGAVVLHDVPAGAVVAGNPAQIIKGRAPVPDPAGD